MKKNYTLIIFIALFFIAAFAMRLLPHPSNFIPIGAFALFSGVYIKSKWGLIIPIVLMLATDMIIGLHSVILFTWGSFAIFGVIGWWIRKNKNVFRIAGGTLAGAVIFYLITNFAVWMFTPLYAKTLAGLTQSYYMAIPFFRNSLVGDLFYVGIFFGMYEVVMLVQKYSLRKKVEVFNK